MIYVVEDDESIREIVLYALGSAGFDVEGFESGKAFFSKIENALPDLIMLDVMLPEQDGLSILKTLRRMPKTKSIPIIMLTAKGSEYDKVKGLDMGADDYIAKPFGVMEMISRVKAVLRRSSTQADFNGVFEYKDIVLDIARQTTTVNGSLVNLTFKEFELLHYFLLNKGLALGRSRIVEMVWGYDFEGESRSLDMHVRSLRKKLGTSGEYIKTIRKVGYMLE
jgi:two-component system alkaline phosphatase synthesis response regulator PhoP